MLGIRNDIADFDSLKLEKGKQTLYGLIETASLILATTGVLKFNLNLSKTNYKFLKIQIDSAQAVRRKGPSVSSSSKSVQTKRVQSKILGDFIPKDASKSTAVDDSSTTVERKSGSDDGRRIVELFERATEASNMRKTQRF